MWNRSLAIAIVFVAVAAVCASKADAAFLSPVYVTAGSVGEAALGAPTDFYVARTDENGTYWPKPGNPQAYFASITGSVFGITVGPDKDLYVSNYSANAISKVTLAGVTSTFVAPGTGGLSTPLYLNHGPTGDLYVTSDAQRRIMRYDSIGASNPSPGHAGTAFFSDVVTTVNGNPVTGAQPVGLTPSRDGTLIVAAYEATNAADGFIGVHDASSGVMLSTLTVGKNLWDIVPVSASEYLVSTLANDIIKVNLGTSSFSTLIPAGQGGMVTPRGMSIGPDGLLYVADRGGLRILRFDPVTGADMPAPGRTGAFHSQAYAVPGGLDFPWDVALPEPSSAMLVVGALGALLARRRNTKLHQI